MRRVVSREKLVLLVAKWRRPGKLEKVEPLIAQDAKAAANVSDACQGDAVITMLASDDAVENVVVGDDGIVARCPSPDENFDIDRVAVAEDVAWIPFQW